MTNQASDQSLSSSTTGGETDGDTNSSKVLTSIGGAAAVGDQSGGLQPLTGVGDQSNSTKIGTLDGSGTPSAGGAGGGT